MNMKYLFSLLFVGFIFSSCTLFQKTTSDNRKIEINLIQVNDVYEIGPLSGGKEGGLARVATLKKQYLKKNPNTFLVITGDFLSPSVFNSIQYEDKPVRGRQMIESLNAAGMDMAIFGNHEFDLRESELMDRLRESKFQWIASNTFHHQGNTIIPFIQGQEKEVPRTWIMQVEDADGTRARIGFFAICLPFNRAEYVSYLDPLATAKIYYNQLKDSVDAVIALTHQSMEDDVLLAREIPGLTAILGGHEHDQRFARIGNIPITKSMANAKSAFVTSIKINHRKKRVSTDTELENLDESVAIDSATNVIVSKWTETAAKNFSALGFTAGRVVINEGESLDGREVVIRSRPTNLGRLVVEAMQSAVPGAKAVLMNSGSIRVDDVLNMPLTEYDIIRTLPFGGSIREVDMKGNLLTKVLEQGKNNVGNGGYLLYNQNISHQGGIWMLEGSAIEPEKIYPVALSEFLLTGKEANLDFLQPENPGIVKTYPKPTGISDSRSDIRLAVIRYLESRK
jgi:5'-nucleotidase